MSEEINDDVARLRVVIDKLIPMLGGMGIKVTQRGTQAYTKTDGRTGKVLEVNVPYLPNNATPELVMAIQGFIDHECSHVLHTDFKAGVEAQREGKKMHSLWNLVEDIFVEREMQKKFKGSAHNLDKLGEFFLEKVTKPAVAQQMAQGKNPLTSYLIPMLRATAGQPLYQEFCDKEGVWDLYPEIKTALKPFADRLNRVRNSHEALIVARELDKALKDAVPPPPPGAPQDGEGDESSESDSDSSDDEQPKDGKKGKNKDKDKDKDKDQKPKEPKKDPSKKDKGDDKGDAEPADGDDEKDDGKKDKEGKKDKKNKPKPEPKKDEKEKGEEDGDGEGDGKDGDKDEDEQDGGDAQGDGDPDESENGDEGDGDGSDGDGEEDDDGEGDQGSGDADGEGDGSDGEGDDDGDGDGGEGQGGEGSDEGGAEKSVWAGIGDGDPSVDTMDVGELVGEAIGKRALECAQNAEYLVYTKDHDVLQLLPLDDSPNLAHYRSYYGDNLGVEKFEDVTRHMIAPMQKKIERSVAARSQIVKVPGFRSGRLHASSLHRLSAGDDRVFRRKQDHRSNDVAVSLVVDNSGSMAGQKMLVALQAAYALSFTLDRLKINHEAIGFTTGQLTPAQMREYEKEVQTTRVKYSRVGPLVMNIFKPFGERLTPEHKRRISEAPGRLSAQANADGESIEVAGRRLLGQKAARHVMIVLSDGQPAADGARGHQQMYLKAAVKWLEKHKVEVIGIGLEDNTVREYYPKFVVLNDVEELPGTIMDQISQLLLV